MQREREEDAAKAAKASTALLVGSFVSADKEGKGYWHCGKLIAANADGTYSITYDDVDYGTESNVPGSRIRAMDASQSHSLAKVEAMIRTKDCAGWDSSLVLSALCC